MKFTSIVACIFLAGSPPAYGQPQFEVASVKLSPASSTGLTYISPPGSAAFTARNASLEFIIAIAFGVDSNRIAGQPSWLDSQTYDINAKPDGEKGLSYEELRPLLQKLLAERLKLAAHREMKDTQGYALVIAKDKPNLRPTDGGPPKPMILRGGIRGNNLSLKTFAAMLSSPTGRPVIDKTGIEGTFDIKLEFAPEGVTDSTLPSIFTALQEQLGLKLAPQKVPTETLVIDHVERIPTEN